jgi:hypothetical protein
MVLSRDLNGRKKVSPAAIGITSLIVICVLGVTLFFWISGASKDTASEFRGAATPTAAISGMLTAADKNDLESFKQLSFGDLAQTPPKEGMQQMRQFIATAGGIKNISVPNESDSSKSSGQSETFYVTVKGRSVRYRFITEPSGETRYGVSSYNLNP